MMQTILNILSEIGKDIVKVIVSLSDAITSCFSYLEHLLTRKEKKEEEKEQQKHKEKVEDVVNNGSLEDLLDLKKTSKLIFISLCLSMLVGCFSQKIPEILVTKSWEGHFMNTNDFYNATKEIKLEKNETIWILSNRTLLRVLENNK